MDVNKIQTLGELKKAGYQSKTIREELRDNLIQKMQAGENRFPGILGYEDTVIPDLERAILSGHNINLLGLRGQAKTRIARGLTSLLDEWVPVLKGTAMNEDPFSPMSAEAKRILSEQGDKAAISWMHREERFGEKLATPDVSTADLIGDIDPIKAANMRLSFADEEVIHYGIIPRSNRGIFVINEIPDLQPRIQVALFNLLQEGDMQIRGFKLRFPLDILFVFTANPEDYTNRGAIVTPLKDRIGSQIITHYPKTRELAKAITLQEAKISEAQKSRVKVPDLLLDLIEQIAIEARSSEYIDGKSGVSARLGISALENLVSAAERRALLNKEKTATARITDFQAILPAITGKVELVYEGEQEGPGIVARKLIGQAIRSLFAEHFGDPDRLKKKSEKSPFAAIENWFAEGNQLDLLNDYSEKEYGKQLESVDGLKAFVSATHKNDIQLWMEFVLFGLSEYSRLNRDTLEQGNRFADLMGAYFRFSEEGE